MLYSVREAILSEVTELIRQDSMKWPATRTLRFSNDIDEPTFDEYDLPLAHVMFGDEVIDEHVLCDPLIDVREAPLSITIYINKYPANGGARLFIDKEPDDLRTATDYIERVSSSISILMQAYKGDRSILDIKLSTLTFMIEAKSNPKVGKLMMSYQCRYQVDLERKM